MMGPPVFWVIGAIFGWFLRGYIDGLIGRLMFRLATSRIGKAKVAAMFADAIANAETRP